MNSDHGFVEKKEMESLEEKAETVQAANDEVPVVEAKQVHKMRAKEYPPSRKFALCGAMGTPSQPFEARMNDPITMANDEVTCPDCLKILAEQEKS
jgi:hypothetical protein